MSRVPTRRLRIFLRDFRMVEALVSFVEGQSLTTYFANRKSYLNLVGTHWASTREDIRHAVLRVDQVLWVSAPDQDIGLTNVSGQRHQRLVEVQLDGGLLVRASLIMGERQRVSDYLDSASQFIPLLAAQLLRSGRPPKKVNVTLGDIVLNQQAIQAVWEVDAQEQPLAEEPAAAVVEVAPPPNGSVDTGAAASDDASPDAVEPASTATQAAEPEAPASA